MGKSFNNSNNYIRIFTLTLKPSVVSGGFFYSTKIYVCTVQIYKLKNRCHNLFYLIFFKNEGFKKNMQVHKITVYGTIREIIKQV